MNLKQEIAELEERLAVLKDKLANDWTAQDTAVTLTRAELALLTLVLGRSTNIQQADIDNHWPSWKGRGYKTPTLTQINGGDVLGIYAKFLDTYKEAFENE